MEQMVMSPPPARPAPPPKPPPAPAKPAAAKPAPTKPKPAPVAQQKKGKGCGGSAAVLLLGVIGLVYWMFI